MAGKKLPRIPVDNPLSKGYLREFKGWTTAYAPGLADPNSLRIMENVFIGSDGSARIRPGLRPLVPPPFDTQYRKVFVSAFEPFFLNNGQQAYLFAWKYIPEPGQTAPDKYAVVQLGIFTVDDAAAEADPDYPSGTVYTWDWAFSTSLINEAIGWSEDTTFVKFLQIDNKVIALPTSSDPTDTPIVVDVGVKKTITRPMNIVVPLWTSGHAPVVVHPARSWYNLPENAKTMPVPANTRTTTSLISSTSNPYRFGYFYTFSNEFGESSASQMTIVLANRSWVSWKIEAPGGSGMDPTGGHTSNPDDAADQLIISLPQDVWVSARAQRATHWNLYMVTWSDQDPVPTEAILLKTQELPSNADGGTWANSGWIRHTARAPDARYTRNLPTNDALLNFNYTTPPSASQGAVVADRLVLVNDLAKGAVIRWSSNELGNYLDTSSSRGGGYKTLSSGNLQVAANVQLWQNPQSVDTITILCHGIDGYSTSYYMTPAEISSQSESTVVMGFEETTATPGTVSPFGVTVHNNALYHPLDDQLMKSTANNYSIHHKNMTEDISNMWQLLRNKRNIFVSEMDGFLYFIVDNRMGAEKQSEHSLGSEIWVLDTNSDTPYWSRWLIEAVALRKIIVADRQYMAVVQVDGISLLDPQYIGDQVVANRGQGVWLYSRHYIPWRLETNTQGANRDHSAWANVQQMEATFGNFYGTARYGIHSWDVNGKTVDLSKVYRQPSQRDPALGHAPYDHSDFLQVRRVLQEWRFYAQSERDEDGVVLPSFGQISLVQFRFTPASVNVGYEYGSVETFEYGRAGDDWTTRTNINGVPIPVIDPRRPGS